MYVIVTPDVVVVRFELVFAPPPTYVTVLSEPERKKARAMTTMTAPDIQRAVERFIYLALCR
jgi:hypothetical protein